MRFQFLKDRKDYIPYNDIVLHTGSGFLSGSSMHRWSLVGGGGYWWGSYLLLTPPSPYIVIQSWFLSQSVFRRITRNSSSFSSSKCYVHSTLRMVLFPWDYMLMTFYENYQREIPMFLPDDNLLFVRGGDGSTNDRLFQQLLVELKHDRWTEILAPPPEMIRSCPPDSSQRNLCGDSSWIFVIFRFFVVFHQCVRRVYHRETECESGHRQSKKRVFRRHNSLFAGTFRLLRRLDHSQTKWRTTSRSGRIGRKQFS